MFGSVSAMVNDEEGVVFPFRGATKLPNITDATVRLTDNYFCVYSVFICFALISS